MSYTIPVFENDMLADELVEDLSPMSFRECIEIFKRTLINTT